MNIFILFGQTASGKTSKALELCEKHNGEIVNFDSRQIYKKLDIITGKDKPQDSKYKIWLYDIIDPKLTFSSAEYVECAMEVIKNIVSRGKTPILVGGTGYYLRHLLYGTPEMKIKEDWNLRKELEEKTVSELQDILKEKNIKMFEALNQSDSSNPRRLIRRIEIAQSGVHVLPVPQTEETLTSRLPATSITYIPFFHNSRSELIKKITARVEARMEAGALEEIKNLLSEGYTKDDPGLNAIGYQQLIRYLNKELTLSEVKKQWATKEVQYAKRQKTYFAKYFTPISTLS